MFRTAARMWQHTRRAFFWTAPLLAVLLLLGAVLVAGRFTRSQIQPLEPHVISFSAIECDVPEGLSRDDFLAEVQYLSGLPERVELLEDGLAAKLATAFARHPRVDRVKRVQVQERRIAVELTFRPRS